jgi:hypothetical protein
MPIIERKKMNSSNELAKAKWLLIAILIFLVSTYLCYAEVAYLVSGRETQANVTSVYEVTKRGRFGINRGKNLRIEYAFAEPDGTRRTDSVTTSTDTIVGPTVPVRYTPGVNGRSRLSGHVNWLGIILFVGSLVAMGIFGYRIWRDYSEGMKPRKSRYSD